MHDIQISKGQYDRVWSYIEAGKKEGAKAILGGVKRAGKGFYVDPTSRCSKTKSAADIHGRC
jgi:acyl-CoA reductase-like NAD-dependent aldehyde dehydrogenase